MKNYRLLIAVLSLTAGIALVIIAGCASAPTSFEKKFMDVTTNYVPVLSIQTNIVTVTNTVGVPVLQTNVVTVTNFQAQYTQTPGAGAKSVTEVGGAVGNLFGVGGLVTTGLGALFSLWGWIRSTKTTATAANLAQTIETLRQFIQQLPDGAAYDTAFVQWMQAHQAEAGVLNQVVDLLEKQVNTPEASVAAAQVRATINALRGSTTPPAPAKV